LSITVRNSSNKICKTASKFEKEILKIACRSSRSLEYAECDYFTLLFCIERQRNEQIIITHAYTAIVHVAVVIVVYSFNSLKPNKWQKNEQPNEHKANESPAEQKDGRVQKISLL